MRRRGREAPWGHSDVNDAQPGDRARCGAFVAFIRLLGFYYLLSTWPLSRQQATHIKPKSSWNASSFQNNE